MNTNLSPSLRRLASVAAALLLSAAAHAGPHFICYQGPAGSAAYSGVFGCEADSGGSCSITPAGSGWSWLGSELPGRPPGRYALYKFPAGAWAFTARIDFVSAAGQRSTRQCTVNIPSADPKEGNPSNGSQLVGFMTDASGLLTTGVWKALSPNAGRSVTQTLTVPGDFAAVGGGVTGTDTPFGAFVVESLQANAGLGNYGQSDWRRMRQWVVKTSDVSAWYAQVHQNTGYVIGLRVNGRLTGASSGKGGVGSLRDLLRVFGQMDYEPIHPMPQNQVVMPDPQAGNIMVSGSVQAVAQATPAQADSLGQFLTCSFPWEPGAETLPLGINEVTPLRRGAWWVESKDHLESRPGVINTATLALPSLIEIDGLRYLVVLRSMGSRSAVAAHPTATVGGLKGEFALTGIGASVDWRVFAPDGALVSYLYGPGSLIWKMEPRADLGGATVASADFAVPSPAAIDAWALGIKLVPAP